MKRAFKVDSNWLASRLPLITPDEMIMSYDDHHHKGLLSTSDEHDPDDDDDDSPGGGDDINTLDDHMSPDGRLIDDSNDDDQQQDDDESNGTSTGNGSALALTTTDQQQRHQQHNAFQHHQQFHRHHRSDQDDHDSGESHELLSQNVKLVKVVPLPHARSEVWSYFGFIADDDGEIQDKKKAICKLCASTLSYSGNTTNLFTHLKAMHPEAHAQKLAPTNSKPRTGKKLQKRKLDVIESSSGPLTLIRAITYSHQSAGTLPMASGVADVITANESPRDSESETVNGELFEAEELSQVTEHNKSTSPSKSLATSSIVATSDITEALVGWLVSDCRPICITEGKGFQELIKLLAPGYVVPEPKRLKTLVKKKYDDVRRELILRNME